jgi:hypothetical protein
MDEGGAAANITVYQVREEGAALLTGILDLPSTCEIERAVFFRRNGRTMMRLSPFPFLSLCRLKAPGIFSRLSKESGEESVRAEFDGADREKSRITLRYIAGRTRKTRRR